MYKCFKYKTKTETSLLKSRQKIYKESIFMFCLSYILSINDRMFSLFCNPNLATHCHWIHFARPDISNSSLSKNNSRCLVKNRNCLPCAICSQPHFICGICVAHLFSFVCLSDQCCLCLDYPFLIAPSVFSNIYLEPRFYSSTKQ
jgi:hypothetical protein